MRVVVAVSGGIAAYKACDVVSRLVKGGHEVRVVMTPAAAQFVAPLTFRALSGQSVSVNVDGDEGGAIGHVALARWAEALVIAPATASLMARLATGDARDMVTLVYMGFRGPVVMAPAMEPEMWSHPRTIANRIVLEQDGVWLVGPEEGRMASGYIGVGRMAEPETIVEALQDAVSPHDLAGRTLVVTAGATWEHFDPVRLLTNPSTGMMGVAVANQAARRGARTVLVAGPSVTLDTVHPHVEIRPVVSALDMLTEVRSAMHGADVLVGAAAVSDFRPEQVAEFKVHKPDIARDWAMAPNPDIIRTMATEYGGQKLMIGFAAETENPVEQAQKKRREKGLDAVLANLVGPGRGFGHGSHQAWLVTGEGVEELAGQTKAETAQRLVDWISERLRGR